MYYFVPLAYDYIQKDKMGGSTERCNALLIKAFKLSLYTSRDRIHFISMAGYSKSNRRWPTASIPKSLSELMIRYIENHFYTPRTFNPKSWGTYEEIRDALGYIKYLSSFNNEIFNEVYFSTNLGHSFRVRLCIFFLSREFGMKKPNWKFKVLRANHSFTVEEWFQETGKFFIYLYRFLFNKSFAT